MKAYHAGERRVGAIKLSSNENPRGASPKAIAAASAALSESHIYPDGAALELKRAIANRHGIDPGMVVSGNGSDEIMTFAAATYLNPGERALIAENTFSQYEFSTRLFDGVPEIIPMNNYRFDLASFTRRVTDPDVRLVFLCSPNNPTGLTIPRSEFLPFMDHVPVDTLVVVDHAYQEFATDPDAIDATPLVNQFPNLLVLRTFSKIFGMAGFRVGYGIGNPRIIADIERARLPFNTGIIAQNAAIAALTDNEFVQKSLRVNAISLERLTIFANRLGLDHLPSQANFLSIHVGKNAAAVVEGCAQGGVTIRHLASFGMPEWVRVTAGTKEQLDLFEKAFTAALAGC